MRKNTILWADDDADDLQLMQEILVKSDHDFTIVEVQNGKEALEYLEKTKEDGGKLPCLIILDINLPILSGQEVLRQIRALPKYIHTPVVFFTTSSQQRDQSFAINHSAGFITKPLTFRQMDTIAEQLLNACDKGIQGGIRNITF